MLSGFFKKTKYINMPLESNRTQKKDPEAMVTIEEICPSIPDGMWKKCSKCGQILYKEDIENQGQVCIDCNHHFRMSASDRIQLMVDPETFESWEEELILQNPLEDPIYLEKLKKLQQTTQLHEAIVTGKGQIGGHEVVLGVMDSHFLMGSMGTIVGEKLTCAIEKATESKLPILIFTASGGARMQEGIFSLMQMAKTSAALGRHHEAKLLSIIVLTDPTTGGVTASFAMLGDIILAEPGALIGFAGPRVIRQTINQELPTGFQTSEFLLEHGFIDRIVARKKMKEVVTNILALHEEGKNESS